MGDDAQQTKEKTEDSISLSTRSSNSWTNPRKRPRSYDPTAQLETTIDEDLLRQTGTPSDIYSPKRIRVEHWPLKSTDVAAETEITTRLAYRKSPSDRQKRDSDSSTRPSKFVEGSMNDKVSQRPPSLYTREEEAMEQYASGNMEDVDMVDDAGIESNRPSGMFRFGKAIANAFNSVNVWQGFNGIWKEKEKENQAMLERDALKAKAELKYAELKKKGYKGTQNAPARPQSQVVPVENHKDTDDSRRSSFRDSGVDVDGYRSSLDRRDSDRAIVPTENIIPPAPLAAGHRSASPFSDASAGRRSSIRFRKPSLEGLKKVKSQIYLSSIKRHAENVPPVPSIETDVAVGLGLHRAASKKDIAKQYKLSKKVSDLENKLEVARRELELSIQTAPPVPDVPTRIGRKPFVPGGLPSLPSERLLMPQTHHNGDFANKSNGGAANAVYTPVATTSTDDKSDKLGEHDHKVKDEIAESAKQELWNKRARDIAARNAAARQSKGFKADTEIDDVLEHEAAKSSVSKRNEGKPGRIQVAKVGGSHDPSRVHKRPPKVYAKTPCSPPLASKEEMPPIPAKSPIFDPTKVDLARIMSLRAIPDSHVPFGKAWDDMINLRKKYPDAKEAELVAYLSSHSASKKATDHTSVSHGGRPSSPFLGRPGSTSPMKTRARASKRGISSPPPSVSSVKKLRRDPDTDRSPTHVNGQSPQADEKSDPFATKAASSTDRIAQEAAGASVDKPLPDPKTDEFEWDDDVF